MHSKAIQPSPVYGKVCTFGRSTERLQPVLIGPGRALVYRWLMQLL